MERPLSERLRRLTFVGVALAAFACSAPSIEDEEEIAREAGAQLRQQMLLLHDDVVESYVEDIGQRIVHAAGPQPYDYTFVVVEDDTLNASAFFGGQIFVHTGLITRVRNVSELAGVLGHEVGHVVHRHIADNYARARQAGILRNVAVIGAAIGGVNPGAVDLLGQLSTLGVINTFKREAEEEADAFAVEVLPRAGYDPSGIVTMFEMLHASSARRPPKFFSDHPATDERIAATKALLAAKALPPDLKREDNGKLEIIQHRIRLLTGEGKGAPPRR